MVTKNQSLVSQVTLVVFIWSYLKKNKIYLCLFMLVSIIGSIEISLSPYLLKLIIDTTNQFSNEHEELLSTLALPVILYIVISLISNLNFRTYDYFSLRFYPKLKTEIIKDMYSHLIKHSDSFFQNGFPASFTKKIFDVSTNVEFIIRTISESFFPIICSFITSSVMLLIVLHYIFAIILILWGICFIFLSYIASKKLENYSRSLSEFNIKISGQISDSISNITAVKLFTAEEDEIALINSSLEHLANADYKTHWQNLKINFVQGISITILIFFMLTILIYGRLQGWVTIGDFALIITLSIAMLMSIYNIGRQIQQFAKAKGICKQALSIMQETHEIVDLAKAKPINVQKGLIEFKNVSFCYGKQKSLFKNLSITLHPEEKIGLVGYSGGGKSTFIKLILRLIEPQSGSILIDNQDIKKVTINSLIKQLTMIPQDSGMLHRTIMENIRFAKPGATDSEVISAAKKAKCHEFICELPGGYESLIGERGVKLSSGQKQRVAIARAFLKNSSILLLDEPTSALDSLTENYIQHSLHSLMRNKTTLVIAHRLSTLKNMDRILVFDNGQIVEDGKLTTLLDNKNGLFYKLWQMQVEGFINL
jgi:ATP-binding cassette subfamily B protein